MHRLRSLSDVAKIVIVIVFDMFSVRVFDLFRLVDALTRGREST